MEFQTFLLFPPFKNKYLKRVSWVGLCLFISFWVPMGKALGQIGPRVPVDTTLNLKAQTEVYLFLEGFFEEDTRLMSTELSEKGLIPQIQPFTVEPFLYPGGEQKNERIVEVFGPGEVPDERIIEVFNIKDPGAGFTIEFSKLIVDWVLIELRDEANVDSVLASQAAFLCLDGLVRNTEGKSILGFPGVPAGKYYIAVHHRGHLGVISSRSVLCGSIAQPYIFFTDSTKALGTAQLKPIGSDYCLIAGDFDNNGILNNLDYNLWRQNASMFNEYFPVDADGNGLINNLDYNLWKANVGKMGVGPIVK